MRWVGCWQQEDMGQLRSLEEQEVLETYDFFLVDFLLPEKTE